MRRLPATLSACLILALVWAPASAQDDGAPFPSDTVAVGLEDSSNTGVTVELSRVTFADGGAEVVLIGRDDVFADSLASGVAQDEGPLLLVPTAGPVPQPVLQEIQRLGARRAVIFGGENAVSPAVASELAGAGLAVERREGPSRIETAVAVARAEAPGAETAILARAGGVEGNPTSGFADALAAGGWAASTGWPVLLTQTEVLTGSTRDYLIEAGITEVKVMGGTAAISEAVTTELQSMGIVVERVAGPDRAATAVEVAKDRGADTAAVVAKVIVVDGFSEDAWAAGFGAAARSAQEDAPIVLGNVDSLPPATVEWLVPGPEALTCALTAEVCQQARLEVGFPAGEQTQRVSVDTSGGDPDNQSRLASVSADGRFVAFQSDATDLVAGDGNGFLDVFVRDLQSGTTQRVSVDTAGGDANGPTADASSGTVSTPSISADGRFVAFDSDATDLVATGSDSTVGQGAVDVFVRDMQSGTTEQVSVEDPDLSSREPSISADGRFVAFTMRNSAGGLDVHVRDRQSGGLELVSADSEGRQTGEAFGPSISADGRSVAFISRDSFVADDRNEQFDVYVRDLQSGTIDLVSVATAGGDGGAGFSGEASISADGRFVAFTSPVPLVAGDDNGTDDVFVRDLQSGTTQLVSLNTSGDEGNNSSGKPSISADGRFVAFASVASDLVEGDEFSIQDVFVRDLQSGTTQRINVTTSGGESTSTADHPSISADGRVVAFHSGATDLVAGDDLNGTADVFARDLGSGAQP